MPDSLVYFVAPVIAFSIPAVVMLMLKDVFLRRRIRYVLRARGTCPACRYSLLGIVVSTGNVVICPECGIEVEADRSLNELTTDEQGRTRFMPTERIGVRRFWTPRRVQHAKRWAIGFAVFGFLAIPLGWGGYELFLIGQAKTAAAERPGAAGILAHVEAHQPPGAGKDSGAINGWVAMANAAAALDDLEFEVLEELDTGGQNFRAYAAYDGIYSDILGTLKGDKLEAERFNVQVANRVIKDARTQGLFDKLDALADHRRAVHEFTLPAGQPAMNILLPNLGDASQLARLNAARMHIAWQAGDRDEFLASFESGLAVARYCFHQPTLIEERVGTVIEALMLDRARVYLLQRPGIEWIEGIEAAIERQRTTLPPDYWFRGNLLYTHDNIAWFFTDSERARLGRFSRELGTFAGGLDISKVWNRRLGTYAQNRDTHAAYMQPYLDIAGTDAYARPAITPVDTSDLLLLDFLRPPFGRVLQTNDHRAASRRATATMLALERFRIDHGNYPASLDELVPGYLADLPLDPWSGKPFRYFLLTRPGTHPCYGLYAFGRDMDDDGGRRRTSKSGGDSDMVFSPE